MLSRFEKLPGSADGEIKRAPQIPEMSDGVPSMGDLKTRLNEIFPVASDMGDQRDEGQKRDADELHPKEVTLDDGTVVTLPDPPAPILHNTATDSSEVGQPNSREGVEPGANADGLTDEQKAQIKEETGWPDEIVDAIGSMEEYEVYKNAGLVVQEVNGKFCLVKENIDWEQKDAMGRTNKERAEQGLSPVDKDGNVIELHHIGQHTDSPLAELTPEEHRGRGNDTVLHDKTKESEIDRNAFGEERRAHWKNRAEEDNKQ